MLAAERYGRAKRRRSVDLVLDGQSRWLREMCAGTHGVHIELCYKDGQWISVPNVGLEAHCTTSRRATIGSRGLHPQQANTSLFGHRTHIMPHDDFLYDYLRPTRHQRYVPPSFMATNDSTAIWRKALSDCCTAVRVPRVHVRAATCPSSEELWSRPAPSQDRDNKPHRASRRQLKSYWAEHLDNQFRDPQIFSQGCIMSVGRSQITGRARSFYQRLLKTTSVHLEEASAYISSSGLHLQV